MTWVFIVEPPRTALAVSRCSLISCCSWSKRPPLEIIPGLDDTITDMMLDSGGALPAALLNLWGLNERARAERKAERQAGVGEAAA